VHRRGPPSPIGGAIGERLERAEVRCERRAAFVGLPGGHLVGLGGVAKSERERLLPRGAGSLQVVPPVCGAEPRHALLLARDLERPPRLRRGFLGAMPG